jgi:hypothetical protein
MNSNENKAQLWEQCLKQGLFNSITHLEQNKIVKMFENTIQLFEGRNNPIHELHTEFFIRLKEEIIKSNSFEEREREYKSLLSNAPPTKIDFSDKVDEPIKNIDNLVEKTQQMRQEVFNSIEPPKQIINNTPSLDIALLIKKQNDILIKILETQQKILQNIKK